MRKDLPVNGGGATVAAVVVVVAVVVAVAVVTAVVVVAVVVVNVEIGTKTPGISSHNLFTHRNTAD
jgi:hypothetical protein